MIRISEYGITSDSHGYSVGKVSRCKNKNTGEEFDAISSPRYYSNIQGCLKYIRKQMHLEVVAGMDGSIADAIEALREADERFERLIAVVETE